MSTLKRLVLSGILGLALLMMLWPAIQLTQAAGISTPGSNSIPVAAAPLADCPLTVTVTITDNVGPGSLREALFDVCSGGTVNFATGLAGQTIGLTSSGLSIVKTVTITNPHAPGLQISGGGVEWVFNIQAKGVVTLSHLSIISGTTRHGGGISNDGTLIVDHCTISGNSATRYGGGIYNRGILTINSSTISSNSISTGSGGGGIYNIAYGIVTIKNSTISGNSGTSFGGGICNDGTLTVDNSTFSGNSSTFYGGGIYNSSDGSLTVYNSTFNGNLADPASGNPSDIAAGAGIQNSGQLTIKNSTFSGNSALGGGGGIDNTGTLTISNITFSGNWASYYGGGIDNRGTLTVNNSTLSNNSSTYGGSGIDNRGTLTVNNSTLSGNSGTSSSRGGGILNRGMLTINNSTLSGNSATAYGGGIYNYSSGTLHLRNSILSNSSTGGDCYGSLTTNLNNLIEDGSCYPAYRGDPLLASLADYSGSTQTFALLPGSLAIDAGEAASCLPTDQRGISRPRGDGCDIGAFESQGFTLIVTGGNHQAASIGSSFAVPLRLTVTANTGEPVDGGNITFTAPGTGPSTTFAPTTTAAIAGGAASLPVVANLTDGAYQVIAAAAGANSVTFSLTNTLSIPLVTLISSPNPSQAGQTVTFTATVTSDLRIPTGSITFVIDTVPHLPPVSLGGGHATLTTASLTPGSHSIRANYSGDASFSSASGTLPGGQTVDAGPEDKVYLPVVVK